MQKVNYMHLVTNCRTYSVANLTRYAFLNLQDILEFLFLVKTSFSVQYDLLNSEAAVITQQFSLEPAYAVQNSKVTSKKTTR
jgi:hypothetical protein